MRNRVTEPRILLCAILSASIQENGGGEWARLTEPRILSLFYLYQYNTRKNNKSAKMVVQAIIGAIHEQAMIRRYSLE